MEVEIVDSDDNVRIGHSFKQSFFSFSWSQHSHVLIHYSVSVYQYLYIFDLYLILYGFIELLLHSFMDLLC